MAITKKALKKMNKEMRVARKSKKGGTIQQEENGSSWLRNAWNFIIVGLLN